MRTLFLSLLLLPTLLIAKPFPYFNPSSVRTFHGEVLSVQTFGYITRPSQHKQVLLRTQNGEITVDVGPDWYLDAQGVVLTPGEKITVEGSLIKVNGTRFVIASSLTTDEMTYKLREKNGHPVWRGR
ncbi:MAG: hypothetical protein S4CHLAM2_01850 [Chlamydiales bacterium]|nr:hypothetical protein [Chlamydiales bacterium]